MNENGVSASITITDDCGTSTYSEFLRDCPGEYLVNSRGIGHIISRALLSLAPRPAFVLAVALAELEFDESDIGDGVPPLAELLNAADAYVTWWREFDEKHHAAIAGDSQDKHLVP